MPVEFTSRNITVTCRRSPGRLPLRWRCRRPSAYRAKAPPCGSRGDAADATLSATTIKINLTGDGTAAHWSTAAAQSAEMGEVPTKATTRDRDMIRQALLRSARDQKCALSELLCCTHGRSDAGPGIPWLVTKDSTCELISSDQEVIAGCPRLQRLA